MSVFLYSILSTTGNFALTPLSVFHKEKTMAKTEIHPSELFCPANIDKFISSWNDVIFYLCSILISDTILNIPPSPHSTFYQQCPLQFYQSSWPISWEFLYGLKFYLESRQTKQLNLLTAINPFWRLVLSGDKWEGKVLCSLNPEENSILPRGRRK